MGDIHIFQFPDVTAQGCFLPLCWVLEAGCMLAVPLLEVGGQATTVWSSSLFTEALYTTSSAVHLPGKGQSCFLFWCMPRLPNMTLGLEQLPR